MPTGVYVVPNPELPATHVGTTPVGMPTAELLNGLFSTEA